MAKECQRVSRDEPNEPASGKDNPGSIPHGFSKVLKAMYGTVDGLVNDVDKVSQPEGDSPGNISTTAQAMLSFELGLIGLCCMLSRVRLREFGVHKPPGDTSSEKTRRSSKESVVVAKPFNEDGARKGTGCTRDLIEYYSTAIQTRSGR